MRYLLVTAFAASMLYGSTYQQFRFFSLENPGGAADAIHYVDMARGQRPDEVEFWHYRWLTPAAARVMQPVASAIAGDSELSIRLAFYFVNFAFSVIACVALFGSLQALGYSFLLSLLGVCALAASRPMVMATATPLVDAEYFCAIAVLVWLVSARRAVTLALMLPILALTKETILPFLLLPLLTPMRKRPPVWAGLIASAIALYVSAPVVRGYYSGDPASMTTTIAEHAGELGTTVRRLFTLAGLHDFQNGFSLLLPMAVAGAWLNARHRVRRIPPFVIATVPIAFGLALLSGNLGRMFFAAFPAVIAYALITVEYVAGRPREDRAPAYDES